MGRALDVLACTQCNAPIPFGDDATTTCQFCKTENKVPENYRQMRAAKALDAKARGEAERVLRKLDRPPWLVTKILARALDVPLIAFWLLFAIPVTLGSIMFAMRFTSWIAPRMHLKSADDVPYWIMIVAMFSCIFVVIFFPRALGILANRRVTNRMRLLVALAARPPKTPGGPSSCRRCGAPLMVETDALLARCAYCGADNAVALRTKLVALASKTAGKLADSVREAAETDRANRRHTRMQFLSEMLRYLWPLTVLAVSFIVPQPAGAVVAGLFLIGYPIYAMSTRKPTDAKERAEGNDVPEWVGWVGPIVAMVIVWSAWRHC